MDRKAFLTGFAAALVLAVLAYLAHAYLNSRTQTDRAPAISQQDAGSASGGTAQETTVTAQDISWRLDEHGPTDYGLAPNTTVSLLYRGAKREIGTYDGTCMELKGAGGASLDSLQPNEISGVVCWWAGGGREVGVFKDSSGYAVKIGELDEGDAEHAPFRSNFKTVFKL